MEKTLVNSFTTTSMSRFTLVISLWDLQEVSPSGSSHYCHGPLCCCKRSKRSTGPQNNPARLLLLLYEYNGNASPTVMVPRLEPVDHTHASLLGSMNGNDLLACTCLDFVPGGLQRGCVLACLTLCFLLLTLSSCWPLHWLSESLCRSSRQGSSQPFI